MKSNNDRLRELIKKHELYKADVAGMLHLPISNTGQVSAVNKWLANKNDKGNFRNMSDANIELLEIKLGERQVEIFESRSGEKS